MDLCIYDKCNNQCIMCTNPDSPWPAWDGSFDYDYDSIVSRLKKDKERFLTGDSIYITGGEPTIHPKFLSILRYLKDNFSKQRIKLLTNGRRFIYKEFANDTLGVNNNFEIDLSIYGANAETHDKVTRSRGSFKQTTGGLKNLLTHKRKGQVVGVRYVITALSYKHIEEFLKMMESDFMSMDRIILIFWEAEARAVKNLDEIKVSFAKVVPVIRKTLSLFPKFKEIRLYHFPLCTVPVEFWPYIWRTLPEDEVTFLPGCDKCGYKDFCLGIQKTYLEYVDDKDFAPITRKIIVEKDDVPNKPIKSINDSGPTAEE